MASHYEQSHQQSRQPIDFYRQLPDSIQSSAKNTQRAGKLGVV